MRKVLNKKTNVLLVVTIVLTISNLINAPVAAQGFLPDDLMTSSEDGFALDGNDSGSPVLDFQLMPSEKKSLDQNQTVDLRSSHMMDDYGYTWDDTIPVDWIDAATTGINTGMTGPSNGQYHGPVNLGFTFPYYENNFIRVYIAASGYLAFTDAGTWPNQSQIPTSAEPNNVIAPYWAPLFLSAGGPSGQVYYLRGGAAPNRYLVVEWYNVAEGIPNAILAGEDTYQFQVILYESGDIRFQYQIMEYSGSNYCGSSGIENAAGLDGLTYLSLCSAAPTDKAVLFSRPAPSARVRVSPPYQSEFITPGESVTFPISIQNLGDLGQDTFELMVDANYQIDFFEQDGFIPLGDTNDDGNLDTGVLLEGDSKSIKLRISAPENAVIGEGDEVSLVISSSLDPTKTKTILLQVAVPSRFTQVFRDDANGAMSIFLSDPGDRHIERTTSDAWWGYNPVIAETKDGSYLYLWQRWIFDDGNGSYHSILEYSLVDYRGQPVNGVIPISLGDDAGYLSYDEEPVLSVAPNGDIGIVWRRRLLRDVGEGVEEQWNVYFSSLNANGEMIVSPLNLTLNDGWYQSDPMSYEIPRFWNIRIGASPDNHFAITWHQETSHAPSETCTSNCKRDDIYTLILEPQGNIIQPVTALTMDTLVGSEGYTTPTVQSLSEDRWIFVYSHSIGGLAFSVLDKGGNLLRPNAFISGSDPGWSPVVFQPSGSDRIIIAWTAWTVSNPQIHWLVLDSESFEVLSETKVLTNPAAITGGDFPSMVGDAQGNAIITWMDFSSNDRRNLYYALFDNNGEVLTPPMVMVSGTVTSGGDQHVESGFTNNSLTTNRQFLDVSMRYWAVGSIESLYDSGITNGCQADPPLFCPDTSLTRAQMAVLLGRAIYGTNDPPGITGGQRKQVFEDVPEDFWAGDWIEQLYADGITRGCSVDPLRFCPEQSLSRAEMAVFLVRIKYGPDAILPEPIGIFEDVLVDHWAAVEIEQLYRDGITKGCGSSPLHFCPDSSTTRAEIAVFLVRTFDLP